MSATKLNSVLELGNGFIEVALIISSFKGKSEGVLFSAMILGGKKVLSSTIGRIQNLKYITLKIGM